MMWHSIRLNRSSKVRQPSSKSTQHNSGLLPVHIILLHSSFKRPTVNPESSLSRPTFCWTAGAHYRSALSPVDLDSNHFAPNVDVAYVGPIQHTSFLLFAFILTLPVDSTTFTSGDVDVLCAIIGARGAPSPTGRICLLPPRRRADLLQTQRQCPVIRQQCQADRLQPGCSPTLCHVI